MRNEQRRKVTNLAALVILLSFTILIVYLATSYDPVIVKEYDTKNEQSSLTIIEHTRTGEKEYIYGVRDGVGNVEHGAAKP